jgi:hypothetical protein
MYRQSTARTNCRHRGRKSALRTKAPSAALVFVAVAGVIWCGAAPTPEAPPSRAATENLLRQATDQVFARTTLRASGLPGIKITVQEMDVAPGADAPLPALGGPALLDPYQGRGSVVVGGKSESVDGTAVLVLPANEMIVVKNPNSRPLGFRLFVFSGE